MSVATPNDITIFLLLLRFFELKVVSVIEAPENIKTKTMPTAHFPLGRCRKEHWAVTVRDVPFKLVRLVEHVSEALRRTDSSFMLSYISRVSK